MLAKSFRLTLAGLSEPAVQRVVVIGLMTAATVFVGALIGLVALVPYLPDPNWAWLAPVADVAAGLAAVALVVVAAYVLFPGLATLVMSFFLEDVVHAVESRHYPEAAQGAEARLIDEVGLGLRLLGVSLLINLVILPLYLILLATGVGSLVMAGLFLLVNAALLGREYFEMVVVRHVRRREVAELRRAHRTLTWRAGLVIAALFMIPIVNLFAPVLGAMLMTHLFHQERRAAGAGPRPPRAGTARP
ncbi:hypothetical protein CCR85_02020 [Rhodothalassium salexigens]|uniref:EI24 domain-containing protein n=1 Tax=Rhodothalassium salexigens TaxID=1086 RepID=UPI0019117B64|nr:EI24 domain-containing protein [Rhodothalassium salexigens]MBK5910269.1 hypothetical protein [Rhodothalassium salexigens]MBK5921370.1 hypothetical protein [Rhodothalassium salexigens]